jgi:hypothetical protein
VLDPDSLVSDYNFPDKDNVRSDEYHVLLDRPGTCWYYVRVEERKRERARQRRLCTYMPCTLRCSIVV